MLVDAHVHIDKYTENLNEAITQIIQHRILTVGVSMDVPSYLRTVEVSKSCSYVIPTFGIHPWEAYRYHDNLSQIDEYLESTPLIGEAGLDFYWIKNKGLYPAQVAVFEYLCKWSQSRAKPMNLHTKGAEEQILKTLRAFNLGEEVIIHWYSGPLDLIDSYLAIGSYFTVSVEVLTSSTIQHIAQIIPADRLLLETDNPGGYEWLTRQRGMPVLLLEVLAKVARLKGIDPVSLEDHVSQNWARITSGIPQINKIEGLDLHNGYSSS